MCQIEQIMCVFNFQFNSPCPFPALEYFRIVRRKESGIKLYSPTRRKRNILFFNDVRIADCPTHSYGSWMERYIKLLAPK